MSHQPQPCPFCDGRGLIYPEAPQHPYTAICWACNGRGTVSNATLPGIEPPPPPPAPKDQKKIDAGQAQLF